MASRASISRLASSLPRARAPLASTSSAALSTLAKQTARSALQTSPIARVARSASVLDVQRRMASGESGATTMVRGLWLRQGDRAAR